MILFLNQDDAYREWVEFHEQGFLLNVGKPDKHSAMLHTSRCSHFYPLVQNEPLTVRAKVCSLGTSTLEDWAKGEGLSIRECTTCKPRDH